MEKDKVYEREKYQKEYRDNPRKYLQTDFRRDEESRSGESSSRQFSDEHEGQWTVPDNHYYGHTHHRKSGDHGGQLTYPDNHYYGHTHHRIYHDKYRHHHHSDHPHHNRHHRHYYDNAEETSQPFRDEFPKKSQTRCLRRATEPSASDDQFREKKVRFGEETVAARKKTPHLDSDSDTQLSSATTLKSRSEYVTTELGLSAVAGHTAKSQKDNDMISTTPYNGTLIYNHPQLLPAYCSPSPHSKPRPFVMSGQSLRHRDERCTNIPPRFSSLASRPGDSRVIVDHTGKAPVSSSRQTMSYEQSLRNRAPNVPEAASKSVAGGGYAKKYQTWRNVQQSTDGTNPDMFRHKPAFVNRETVTSMTEGGIDIYSRYDYKPYSLQSSLPVQQSPGDPNCKNAHSNLAELSEPMDTSDCSQIGFDRKERKTAEAVRMEKLQAGSHEARPNANIEASQIEAAETEKTESGERGAGTEKPNHSPHQSTSKSQDHPRSKMLHLESASAVSNETDADNMADEDLAPVSDPAHAAVHKRDKYTCHECCKVLASSLCLKAHMRVHRGDKQHGCDTCHKVFRWSSHLRAHISAVHRREKPHACHECTKAFGQPWHLRRHIAAVHRKEKPHFCEECGKTFSRATDIKRHMRVHTGEKPYECETCGAAFSHDTTLKLHLRIHTGEKPYKCQECSKAFNAAVKLKQHSRVHTGEKPYECETCGTAFSQVGSLRRHLRVHTGEKPYTCETCGDAFRHASTLKMHLRVHTGEKPYKCAGCRKAFRFYSNLKAHQRNIRHPYVHVRRTALQNQCV